MLNLTRICFVALTIVLTIPVSADTEFKDYIPSVFAEGLFGGADFGQPTFYSDIVDSFPKFDIPEQFDLLGSVDLVYGTRVILRANMNTDEARQVLINELLTTKVKIIPTTNDTPESVGFIPMDWPVLPITFCHDDFGSVLARFRKTDSYSIITLDHSLAGPSNRLNCTDYVKQRLEEVAQFEARRNQGLKGYQPRLVFPQPSSEKKMSRGTSTSSSGSDDYYESATVLVTEWRIAETYKHFADQIGAQGWELKFENTVGAKTVGEWINSPDADLSLFGTFTVQKTGESRYHLVFRMDRNLYIKNNRPGSPIRSSVR